MSRRGDECGASALELCLWVLPVLGIGLLLALMAQIPMARLEVTAAANDAARAASLQRDAGAASTAATAAARDAIGDSDASCGDIAVNVDLHDFRPDGNVSATVRCTARFSDILGIGIPGSKTLTASAESPIDRYRSAT